MDTGLMLFCLAVAALSGFIHGAIGLGYGMVAMALLTLRMPYNQAAAVVSSALLVVVCELCWTMRGDIDWSLVAGPSISLLAGKVLGIVLLMQLQSGVLRVSLGVFLIVYAASQPLGRYSLRVRGTPLQGLVCCFLGGLFGGVFNVSGPAASIYYRAVCPDDTRRYAACLNFAFVPSAFVGVAMHAWYGNFTPAVGWASLATVIGAAVATGLGVRVLCRINAKKLHRATFLYIGIMGVLLCFGAM